ncbi:MAG: hypothetical protein GAK45_00910 [Pseudomonas citronellolis]|nr:MAG: hypothetical protein GAK45_00910 [Pseudomonas citronellolis]
MRVVAALLLLSCLAGCQASRSSLPPVPAWQSPERRDNVQAGAIYDLRAQQRLTPEQLVERLAGAPIVLVGEQHDNPDHHALERWVIQALATRREQGSVALEMLDPSQQQKVAQAQAAPPPKERLAEALGWQAGWDWSLYGPLLGDLVYSPVPLLAANLERSEVLNIYQVPVALDGKLSTAAPVREALLEDIRQSHCGLLPESQMPAMLAVQQRRDRRMAERLVQAPRPTLLVAGGFHVRRDLGVPLHLQDLDAEKGTQVLMLAEAGSVVTVQQADFVWYTPAQLYQDHCAELRRAR